MVLRAFNVETALVADAAKEVQLAQIRMQWWRDGIATAYTAAPLQHPVVQGLAQVRVTHFSVHEIMRLQHPVEQGLTHVRVTHYSVDEFMCLQDLVVQYMSRVDALQHPDVHGLTQVVVTRCSVHYLNHCFCSLPLYSDLHKCSATYSSVHELSSWVCSILLYSTCTGACYSLFEYASKRYVAAIPYPCEKPQSCA
jgi:hypothetical protein